MSISGNSATDKSSYHMEFSILDMLPVGVVMLDAALQPTFINQNFFRFSLIPQRNIEQVGINGFPVSKFITQEELNSLKEGGVIEKTLQSQKVIDGSEILLVLKAVPINNEDVFSGIIMLIEDIKIPEEQVQRSGKIIENYFENILNKIWSLFILVTGDGKVLMLGGNKLKLFIKKANAKHEYLHELFKNEFEDKIIASFKGAILKKQSEEIILEIPKSEGKEVEYFECAIAPIPMEKSKTSIVFVSIREITTFLKMIENYQRELSELQQYYKFTQEIAESVFVFDKQMKIVFWNRACEKVYQLRRSEVFGKKVQKIFPFINEDFVKEIYLQSSDESTHQLYHDITLLNGVVKHMWLQSHIIIDDESNYIAVIGADLTEMKQSETMIKSLLGVMSDYFKHHAIPGLLLGSDGKILLSNTAFNDLFKERIVNNPELYFIDLLDTTYVVKNDITFHGMVHSESGSSEVPLMVTRDSVRLMSVQLHSITGEVTDIKYFCSLRDITAERAINDDLELLRSVFAYNNDGMAVELDSTFVLVNEAFAQLFGYASPDELMGEHWDIIVATEELSRIREYSEKRIRSGDAPDRYEFFAKRKDATNFYAEISVTKISILQRSYFVVVARDVTEIKRSQQVIKESEEKYRSITENIDDFFWTAELINDKMKPVFYTNSVEKMTGYTQTDFLSESRFFFKIIHPDDFATVKDKLKRFYSNYYKRSEELDFRIVHNSGNVVWVRNKINVLRDRRGKVLKVFGLVSDISMQKKAEEERAHSAANLQKLNETKDKFISIISHDLRTPFSSILGFTDLLLNEDDLTPEEARQYIMYIQESSHNMLALVNSLLDWTRIQTGRVPFEPKHMHLRDFVQSVFGGLHGVAVTKGVELVNSVDEEMVLFVDQSLTMQIFNNLLSNALKFTPTGGTITIMAKQSAQPRFVEVFVSDTGTGIKTENLSKIFNVDSKFTTEGTSGEKGTGLGLSLVREIVEKHGGVISVQSEFGSGTTFCFTLPKASATILLVDDSNTDRILYSKILKSIVGDYEILTAHNGAEGLELLKSNSPALIITDHAMPVMNGYQFIAELKRLKLSGKPPIMVLSGDIKKNEHLMYSDIGVDYVFTKPVNLASFKSAVEKALKQLPKS